MERDVGAKTAWAGDYRTRRQQARGDGLCGPEHPVHLRLGHANLSQTSTYLHATEPGLAELMTKFDASRCTPVADGAPIEPPSIGNEEAEQTDRSTLH